MKRITENRTISYIIITIIYILATFIGVLTYNALDFEWWINLLVADVVATVVTFIFSMIFCLGAVANTLLFLFVSIPLADGRQSSKPGFDDYRSETRMLLPIKRFK